jgi:hypothetical protein
MFVAASNDRDVGLDVQTLIKAMIYGIKVAEPKWLENESNCRTANDSHHSSMSYLK